MKLGSSQVRYVPDTHICQRLGTKLGLNNVAEQSHRFD
jgi:hypothetical protein